MIAAIRGRVSVRRQGHVVLEAAGVGYRLETSAQTLRRVPAIGQDAHLHTHLIGRDDGLTLYGFASEEERELFLMLISVAGVGPKMALAALSASPPRELLQAIAAGDAKRFQAVPGIGRKTANRVIVELSERVAGGEVDPEAPAAGATQDPRIAARDGLIGLGYSFAEADGLLNDAGPAVTAEELIGAALRSAARASS